MICNTGMASVFLLLSVSSSVRTELLLTLNHADGSLDWVLTISAGCLPILSQVFAMWAAGTSLWKDTRSNQTKRVSYWLSLQTGNPGEPGNRGAEGSRGQPGIQGPAGTAGPRGMQGNRGAPGPRGTQGPAVSATLVSATDTAGKLLT